MHPRKLSLVPLLVMLPLAISAQIPSSAPVADPFHDQALVIERSETTYLMHADGTGERLVHVMLRIQSEGAARQFGVLSFSYASANETPHIQFVRVHKADGTTVETPTADAIEMTPDVTRDAPLYSDLKEKHLPVRSLSAGDKLEYEVDTSIDKAEAPNQFWGANHFSPPGSAIVLAEILNLEVPKDKYVQVWSPNHKPTITEKGGTRLYSWNVPQLVPPSKSDADSDADKDDSAAKPAKPKDPDLDTDGRALPSVAWTTFHNWAEVGDWYRGLALGRAEPGDALRVRANEITKDASTPEAQVRAIYNFVSARTRYIGIDFGVGRYQPHAAADVLADQYGDCKDKDTLLEALLRAKGFVTAPALIGAGIVPVPDVPSPAVFNHVITTVTLPEGRIWLDSTPEVAPYRYLSTILRDELALVIPASAPATLERTPDAAPYPFEEHFEAVAELTADGKLTGKMNASYRSDKEIVVRALARGIAPAEWDKASQYISYGAGFGGTTSNTAFKNTDKLDDPIVLTYEYTRKPFGDWENLRIVPLFPAMEFIPLASEKWEPDEPIDLGAMRRLVAISRIQLPDGYHTDLPDPIHVKTSFATMDKTYRFDGQEIVTERTIVVLQKKLPKSDWKQYLQFTKDIGLAGEPWIQLIKPEKIAVTGPVTTIPILKPGAKTDSKADSKSTLVTIQPVPSDGTPTPAASPDLPSGATTQELMEHAGELMRSQDLSGATAALDKVKARNPDEQYLWADYGAIAATQRKYDDAKTDFEKELAKYPDESNIVGGLAEVEKRNGDSTAAEHTIQSFLEKHPDNLRLSLILASLETTAEDYAGALKTLQSAADLNPDNRSVRLQLSNALLKLDRNDEAAAAAKSVLDGTEEAGLLNDAAYVLAETGQSLSYAEDASRKSIAKLEEQSAAITTEEVNSNAFAQTNLLIASWDTLGWILYRENKLPDAKPYLVAAWRNSLRPEVGDHLAQLYEAMGDKDEASKAYTLALASIEGGKMPSDIRREMTQNLAKLKSSGAKAGPKDSAEALQNSRNYKLPVAAGVTGWGTFRLQIAGESVIEAQQMSGEKKLANLSDSIKAVKFPELLPTGSKAHLLRSAVVSCSSSTGCELVLVPNSSLRTEQY